MEKIAFKCHRSGATYQQPHFFVLCKGENSGKPLREPCANCFVVLCETMQACDFMFWLSWGMWQGKAFHAYIGGSVIPFITLYDYRKLMNESYQRACMKSNEVLAVIELLKKLSNSEILISKQLRLLKQAKAAIYHEKIRMQI